MYISKLESDIDLEKIYNPPVRDKNDIFSSYNLEHRFYLIALINSLLLGLFFSFFAVSLRWPYYFPFLALLFMDTYIVMRWRAANLHTCIYMYINRLVSGD